MKDKEAEQKASSGLNYLLIGLVIVFLPLIFATANSAFGIVEGASIGAGLIFVFTAPVGITLIIVGVLRMIAQKPKK